MPVRLAEVVDDGTGPATIAGTYTNPTITLDADGKITAAASGAAGGEAFPVGSLFVAVVPTSPATLLGYGTWSAIGTGQVPVGVDSGDAAIDAAEKTTGAKTVAAAGSNSAPTFSGSALASHDHDYTQIVTHTHGMTVLCARSAATGADSSLVNAIADTSATVIAPLITDTPVETNQETCTTTADSAGTPAGTVSAPTFTGSATSVVQPSFAVYFWKRTA
jgi:hypothetical protein